MNRSITPLIIVTVIFVSSQVAQQLGDEQADYYRRQSQNYRNIFDQETGFMRAKDPDGAFRPEFSDTRWGFKLSQKAVRGKVVLLFTMISLA